MKWEKSCHKLCNRQQERHLIVVVLFPLLNFFFILETESHCITLAGLKNYSISQDSLRLRDWLTSIYLLRAVFKVPCTTMLSMFPYIFGYYYYGVWATTLVCLWQSGESTYMLVLFLFAQQVIFPNPEPKTVSLANNINLIKSTRQNIEVAKLQEQTYEWNNNESIFKRISLKISSPPQLWGLNPGPCMQ